MPLSASEPDHGAGTSAGRCRRRLLVGCVGVLIVVAGLVAPGSMLGIDALPAGAQSAGASALVPVEPCRLFDSRETPNAGRVDARTWRLQIAGKCNVPASATAVTLVVAATDATGSGYVTVWPSGGARPLAANLNFRPGNIVANSAVVQLSPTGAVDVYTHAPVQVVVDITAAFVPAPTAVAAGRYVPADPVRLLDTRETGQRGSGELRLRLPAGVPADVTALAVTIVVVDAAAPGYLTAFPDGHDRPLTSVVNADLLNRTRANLVFLPVSSSGFRIHRSIPTDVVVDLWGWFTGPSAEQSDDGRFVPQPPARVWDSRTTNDPVHASGTVEKRIAPAGAAAVVANVASTESVMPGYVTVHAAGTPRPWASSLNNRWPDPIAALAVAQVSDRGVAFYAMSGTHLVVDVAGWFSGTPRQATTPPSPNTSPPPTTQVLFVSDSAFAGIRWNGALGYLQGAHWDHRLESCRRLIGASCRGRERYAPRTAEAEVATAAPGRYRFLVNATGYNDWSGLFPWGVDAVIGQARAKGIDRVVWMTYRENVSYVSPQAASNRQSFIANNAYLRAVVGSGRYPELILADWSTYAAHRPAWFTADGVHLTTEGARQAAAYTSRKLAFLERRPCPPGLGGATAPGGWCADPDATGPP